MKDSQRQTLIGCSLVGGGCLFVSGLVLTLMFAGGGVLRGLYTKGGDLSMYGARFAGLAIATVGALLGAVGVAYGLWHARDRSAKAPQETAEGVVVVAKFASDLQGNLVMYDDAPEPESTRFYVRLAYPSGKRAEMRCDHRLYQSIGEGMVGTITFQGQWLGWFEPDLGRGSVRASEYDDI